MRDHHVDYARDSTGNHHQRAVHRVEGDLDVRGLLGLDDSVSPGYEQICIRMKVKADCSDEELDDLQAYSQQH